MTDTIAIDAAGLAYRYRHRVALSGIDLRFDHGVLGLLGPNGAGKTTLLNLLATLVRPPEGSLRLLGFDPRNATDRRQVRRRLGYLPQAMGHFPDFSASEFVEYFALMKGVPPRRADGAVTRALERVGLQDLTRSKLKTLSGGQLRRVGIAQAIVNEPDLLLLDEPTAGLDPGQRVTFRSLLRQLGERSTVVVSTHLVEDVASACSEVTVLSAGRVVFSDRPELLADRGDASQAGDSAIERGYDAVQGGTGWTRGDQ